MIHLVSRWHEIWTLNSVIDPHLHTTQYTLIVPTAICGCKECINSELWAHLISDAWLIINTWHTVTMVTKFVETLSRWYLLISTSGLYFVIWALAARCYKTQCASSPPKIQHASRRHLTWQVTIQPIWPAWNMSSSDIFLCPVGLMIHLVSRWHEIWTLNSVIRVVDFGQKF